MRNETRLGKEYILESHTETAEQLNPDRFEGAENADGNSANRNLMEFDLPLSEMFEILRNQRRQHVLQYLHSENRRVTLSDLSEQIAAWENEKEVRQISSSERKRVYVSLYQCHLPKMDGMDIISFNKPRGTIELGECSDSVLPYLQREEPPKSPLRSRYSIGISIFFLAVFPSALVFVFGTTVSLVAAVCLACFVVLAEVFHLEDDFLDGRLSNTKEVTP